MPKDQSQSQAILIDSQQQKNDECIIISPQQDEIHSSIPNISDNANIQDISENNQKLGMPLNFIPFNQILDQKKKEKFREAVPWLSEETASIKDSHIRLHNQIIDFYHYIRPTSKSKEIRTEVLSEIIITIKSLFPHVKVQVFGSFATQLYLPDGDIDITILTNSKYVADDVYEKLSYTLRKNPLKYKELKYIRGAKVPVIKFIYGKQKIPFDISVDSYSGFQQIEYVKKINQAYPQFKYFVFVFKCFLRLRQLSDTFRGGIGSFLLFSLIHVYLQEANRQKACNCSLAEHIVKFLQFYGEIDWSCRVVYVKHGIIQHRQRQTGTFSCISPQDSD